MWRSALGALAAGALFAALACGRSSPDPCPVGELPCGALRDARVRQQAAFDTAASAGDGDAASAAGTCMQAIVDEQLERACISDLCAELCTVHPCALRDPAVPCAAACASLAIDTPALARTLQRAAATPALCSCAVCDDESAPLCTALWACGAGAL